MFNFLLDFIDAIVDIYETVKDKEEKVIIKVIFIIITLVLLYFSWKLWV
ncbi:MAG: hypothetical protein ACRDAU_14050 [Clostridium sp.]